MALGEAALGHQCLGDVDMPIITGTVYVATTGGDDTRSLALAGISTSPWKTLGRINNCALAPGATILLNAGDTFPQAFLPMGGGASGNPVTLSKYGTGSLPAIRPSTLLPSAGWATVRSGVYSIACAKPALLPIKNFLGGTTNSFIVYFDTSMMNTVASAAAVSSPGDCFWGGGVLTLKGYVGDNPNTGFHFYSTSPSNIASPDPTYGGNVGVELRYDYLTIDSVDVQYAGHACIGQGYNQTRYTLGSIVTNCSMAVCKYAAMVLACDNTGITGPHVSNNSITQAGGNGFGIVAIDPNLGWIKNLAINGNSISSCNTGIAIGGSADSITISGNTLNYCVPGIAALSDIGLGTEYPPTNVTISGNTLFGDGGIAIQVQGSGASFGSGCAVTGNTVNRMEIGVAINGGIATSGVSITQNIICNTGGNGILLSTNATGVSVEDNLITGCATGFAGTAAGLHISRTASSITVYNNTLDQNQVGLWIESTGAGSGSHVLANNTVTSSVAQDFLIADATQLASSSHNNAYGGGTPGYNGAYTGLSAWQAAGFEAGSLSVAPSFVGPLASFPGSGPTPAASGYALTAASPLLAAGIATALATDYFGTAFHAPPAIGFYSSLLVSVSATYSGALAWSRALARSSPGALALTATQRASGPASVERLARAAIGSPSPLALAASRGATTTAPAGAGASLAPSASLPGAYTAPVQQAAPAPVEWQKVALGTAAGRTTQPIEWRGDMTAGLPAGIEAAAAVTALAPQPAEWGLASVSPSAVGNTPMPLEWRAGRAVALAAPIATLAGNRRAASLFTDWIAPARGAAVTLPTDSAASLRGQRQAAPIEYRAGLAGIAAGPVSWRAGQQRAAALPTAWEGHATVAQATLLSVDWLNATAGSRAGGLIAFEASSGALARFAAESLSLLAQGGLPLPLDIGAAPFIAPAIHPALRVGLYRFAMKGIHGRYMLGGVLARVTVSPSLVTTGPVRAEGSAASFNRASGSGRIGQAATQGRFGAIDIGGGGAKIGEAATRGNVVLIYPNLAAGVSRVGPLSNHGSLFLVPPIQFAGAAKTGAAISQGSLAALNAGSGVGVAGPATALGTTVNIQPNRLTGLASVGSAAVAAVGEQTNFAAGSQQEGAMKLSGALTSVDTLDGSLAIDVNAPLIGGGTAAFSIPSGGISLSTVGFVDLGGGTALNLGVGAAYVGPAALFGTMVITTYNNLATTLLPVGAVTAGATLFTESLAITLPSAAQGVPIALSGTYTGGPPTAISSSFDGVTWTPLTGLAIGALAWSGTAPALFATGPATIQARDANHTGVSATSASFTVASSAPGAPTSLVASGAATASASMHGFFAADPDENGNSPTGRVLTVGAGGGYQYTTVAAAIAASLDGDTIQVQAGTYVDDTAQIRTSITLQAAGGRVIMYAPTDLANQKGILIIGTLTLTPTVTVNGFDFTGANTSHGANGAGIRYSNGFLTCTNCYFHDNENGILADAQALGTIFIDHCEFAHNGNGNGLTHNMYIGIIKQFTIQNSYSHDSVIGHEVKSRALSSTIVNNRIFDNNGTGSYSIDLPQGGNAVITGNIVQKGVNSRNTAMIAYNEEATTNPGTSVQISGNTFINDFTGSAPKVVWNQTSLTPPVNVALTNNKYWGVTSAQIVVSGTGGTSTQVGNTFLASRPTLDTTTIAYASSFPTIAAHSAVFETRRIAHAAATGDAPVYANVGVNSLHDWSAWVADMTYLAFSWAADSHAAAMTPIMAVPLCLATDNGNPAPAYQAIVAGTHDAVFTGLINAWKSNGFSTIYARIGHGGNDGTQAWDVGTDLTQAGQWIAAFQHVVGLFRAVSGITVKIIWNPAITGARPLSVDQIYPGDAFVDAIGLSVFSGVIQVDNYSWNLNDGSTFEPDFATFMTHPINRAHYWNWPSGTQANPTGVAGDGSFGIGMLVSYAQAHGKPICVPASGVGNINDPNDTNVPLMGVWDDDAFPANLATMLFGPGVPPCLFIEAWDTLTTRGDWTFSDPSYTGALAKPNATAAWGSLFTTEAAVSDSVTLSWTAPVITATGYGVQYKLSSVGSWSAAIPPVGAATTVTVGGLAGATNYDFRVNASNASGTGPYVTITAQAVP